MARTIQEKYCDILVIGGGLPGVCAAIAAGRMGCKVTLVERGTTLGGNCGPEVGVCPSDGHRFHPYMASSGIVGKLIEDAAKQNAKTVSNWHLYNISMQWDTIMAQALKNAGVTVLRRHFAHTPEMDGNKIAAVLCEDTATYHPVRIHVKHMVIDASGDGNVSAEAGAKWRMGRESKEEYGERSGQEIADKITMGTSLVCLIRKTDRPVKFIPPEGTPPFHPSYRGMTPFAPKPEDECVFFYPCETGGDIDTVEDDHEIYERLIYQLYSAWNRVKNVTHVEEAKNWELTWVSARTAKRESRRFVGDYTLTQNDLEQGTIFPDTIATGGFGMDIHDPRPENPEYIKITYYSIPPTYGIPYRCCYSVNIDNLFFASRLLSVTHMAHGSVRVQRTLATIGESVGTAAAMCVQHGLSPRGLLPHIQKLQDLLAGNDASIPVPTHPLEGDIANQASVSASSCLAYGVGAAQRWDSLDRVRGVELWDFCNRVDQVKFLLRNEGKEPAQLTAHLLRWHPKVKYALHGERKRFDYHRWPMEIEWGAPHQLDRFEEIAQAQACLKAGEEGYAAFDFQVDVSPKDMLNDDDRMLVVLDACDGVSLGMRDDFVEYARSIEGIESDEYQVYPRTCCYQILPQPAYGEPEQALTTMNRRYATMPVNMWRTKELPATLTLKWPEMHALTRVDLTFDTFTRNEAEMPFEKQILPASPQCPVEYTLQVFKHGQEVWNEHTENNHNRFRRHDVPVVVGDEIRLTVLKTQLPDQIAGVYRIAVFSPEVALSGYTG